ncbi:unnamed protein product [Ceratitis capitata]|uniref:(Mediterranean fruit fly) hypothetical protein n=2 Tax=Ceratitis capitata TaxID=7213 RepID=A0A811U4D8_CERCA|nr:unnamed protein product [Ceratitis capitata]
MISGTAKSTGNFLSHIKRRHKDILSSCQIYCQTKTQNLTTTISSGCSEGSESIKAELGERENRQLALNVPLYTGLSAQAQFQAFLCQKSLPVVSKSIVTTAATTMPYGNIKANIPISGCFINKQ